MTKTWSNGLPRASSGSPRPANRGAGATSGKGSWGITIHIGNGHSPVYQQLVDQIRFHIAVGHLQAGSKLPTIRELASALGINFNTVAKAYHDLASQQLVVGRKGGGSSVTEPPPMPKAERQKKIVLLYQRLIAEAASYGFSAKEIKRLLQKESIA